MHAKQLHSRVPVSLCSGFLFKIVLFIQNSILQPKLSLFVTASAIVNERVSTAKWRWVTSRSSDMIHFKVEEILEGCLDSISSPSVEIQIMGGKVCLRCKGKTLVGFVNKLWKQKVCWHHPAIFCHTVHSRFKKDFGKLSESPYFFHFLEKNLS